MKKTQSTKKKARRPILRKVRGTTVQRPAPTRKKGKAPAPRKTSMEAPEVVRPPEPVASSYVRKRDGAFLILFDEKQRVLVGRQTERHKPKKERRRQFTLPGGGIERGELPVFAALEETAEEVGHFVTRRQVRLVGDMIQRVPNQPHANGSLKFYEGRYRPAPRYQNDGELEDLQFMSIEEVVRRRDEFLPTMLRAIWLAHVRRNAENALEVFEGNIGLPIVVTVREGRGLRHICV